MIAGYSNPMEFTNGQWDQLSPRSYVATCEPAGVNVGLVVGDRHALLIDAGASPAQGKALAQSAAEFAGRQVDRVVITHGHWDHWFGLAGLNAELSLGHENLRTLLQSEAVSNELAGIGIDQRALLPDTEISLVKALDLGGVRVEIVWFGAAHTTTDLVVLVPDDEVAFVGDLLEEGADPSFEPDSDLEGWPRALDGVLETSTEATRFVPGHGGVVDRNFVIEQRGALAMIYPEAERLARSGVSERQALTAVDWPFGEQAMANALRTSYAALAARGVKANLRLPLA